MNDKTQEMLIKLAEKIGTTTEYLWEVLCKQSVIEGITYVCGMATLPILIFVFFKWLFYTDKNKTKFTAGTYFCHMAGLTIFGVAISSFILASVINFTHILSCFINPEYVALDKLISMLSRLN